jgi:hypothetical protein
MVIDLSKFGLLSGHFYGKRSRLANCSKNRSHFSSGANEIAEQIAKAVLAEPLSEWRYRAEDTEVLREWTKDRIASEVLLRWAYSEDATLSMTAIALMNDQRRVSSLDLAALRTKLNEQCRQEAVPSDGLDPVAQRTESWCTNVYGALATEMLT